MISRFMAKVKVNDNSGCWEWQANKSKDGYGYFWKDGKGQRAHRVSFEIYKEEIKEGNIILHKCDNPCCVNPEHLSQGTHQDNKNDCISKERNVTPTPPVKYGEEHGCAKLTEDDVRNIRLDERGSTTVAREYGLSKSTVLRIRSRKIWKHVV